MKQTFTRRALPIFVYVCLALNGLAFLALVNEKYGIVEKILLLPKMAKKYTFGCYNVATTGMKRHWIENRKLSCATIVLFSTIALGTISTIIGICLQHTLSLNFGE